MLTMPARRGASKYNAVAIQGIDSDGDNELKLDNVEYAACPAGAHLNFQLEDSEDTVLSGLGVTSAVSTTLALMPCNMDLENLVPGRTTLSFDFRDEFESGTSLTPVNVDCWGEFRLADAPLSPTSQFWYSRIEATEPFPRAGGFVGVANVQRVDANGGVSTAATNLHFLGNTPGTCELAGTPCTSNTDCIGAGDSCLQNFGNPGAVIRLPATAF